MFSENKVKLVIDVSELDITNYKRKMIQFDRKLFS